MNTLFQEHLEHRLSEKIRNVGPVSGGDISQAFKVNTSSTRYFVKVSSGGGALPIYETEAKGLRQLAATDTIAIPKVFFYGEQGQMAYLVLEFIESKRPEQKDFESLGQQLAALHLKDYQTGFGNDHDNFIGGLPQSNKGHEDWYSFYAHERLQPQLQLALEKGLLGKEELPEIEYMIAKCGELMGNIKPSLLHGDLWSGNFLISTDGNPYLIDSSVYVGHAEVDLAMTRLFGGFSDAFYRAYHKIIPPHHNQKELTEIYQLYYLLVHLNLFGLSYQSAVLRILKTHFG